MGHILRSDENNLMRKVTCNERLQKPEQLYKRSGQPRLNWIDDNQQRAFAGINNNEPLDIENDDHIQALVEAAKNYDF